jgi:hypothetical protein
VHCHLPLFRDLLSQPERILFNDRSAFFRANGAMGQTKGPECATEDASCLLVDPRCFLAQNCTTVFPRGSGRVCGTKFRGEGHANDRRFFRGAEITSAPVTRFGPPELGDKSNARSVQLKVHHVCWWSRAVFLCVKHNKGVRVVV